MLLFFRGGRRKEALTVLDTASLKSFLDRLVNTPDLLSRADIASVATLSVLASPRDSCTDYVTYDSGWPVATFLGKLDLTCLAVLHEMETCFVRCDV